MHRSTYVSVGQSNTPMLFKVLRSCVPVRIGLLAIGLSILAPNALAQDCPLKGEWVSNEKMTVASLQATGKVSEQQRKTLSSGFFGKMKFSFTCDRVITTAQSGKVSHGTYKVQKADNTRFKLLISEDGSKEAVASDTATFTADKTCFFTTVGQMNFQEYFCKTP